MSGRSRGKPTARPICALSFETGARDAPRRDRPRLAEPRSEPAGSNGYLAERRVLRAFGRAALIAVL